VVSAEIAKIHTIEWTPQLLYNEPLYKGMNANWNGLLGDSGSDVSKALSEVITKGFGHPNRPRSLPGVLGARLGAGISESAAG